MGALYLITGSLVEPLSLDEAKNHLRAGDSEDDLIRGLITASREAVENFTGRSLITQHWQLWEDNFPGVSVILPFPPLQSVVSVSYYASGSTTKTDISSSKFFVDSKSTPGKVVLHSGQSWPTATLRNTNGFVIEYVSGYGDSSGSVVSSLRSAMLFLVGHWYANRESVVLGTIATQIPMTAKYLMYPYRTWF